MMKKFNLFLIGLLVLATAVFVSCNNEDTSKKESETLQANDSAQMTTPPAVESAPKVKDNSKVSIKDVAPGDATVVRRTKELYVNSKGELLAAVYGVRMNNKGLVVIEKVGIPAVTLQQESGTEENAVYGDGKITWTLRGSEATLTKDGVQEKFIKQ